MKLFLHVINSGYLIHIVISYLPDAHTLPFAYGCDLYCRSVDEAPGIFLSLRGAVSQNFLVPVQWLEFFASVYTYSFFSTTVTTLAAHSTLLLWQHIFSSLVFFFLFLFFFSSSSSNSEVTLFLSSRPFLISPVYYPCHNTCT